MSSVSHISISSGSNDESTGSSTSYIILLDLDAKGSASPTTVLDFALVSDTDSEPFEAPPSPDYASASDDDTMLIEAPASPNYTLDSDSDTKPFEEDLQEADPEEYSKEDPSEEDSLDEDSMEDYEPLQAQIPLHRPYRIYPNERRLICTSRKTVRLPFTLPLSIKAAIVNEIAAPPRKRDISPSSTSSSSTSSPSPLPSRKRCISPSLPPSPCIIITTTCYATTSDQKGEPITYEIEESSLASHVLPVTSELVYHIIPLLVARLVQQMDPYLRDSRSLEEILLKELKTVIWRLETLCDRAEAAEKQNIPTTRQVLNFVAIEKLIAQHIADAMTAYEANQNSRNGAVYETSRSARGNVTSSKPRRIWEAIRMAHHLMDHVVRAKAAKSGENKRKWEDNHMNNSRTPTPAIAQRPPLKNERAPGKCFEYGLQGHYRNEYNEEVYEEEAEAFNLMPKENKDFVGRAWGDSEDSDEPQNDATCLMAVESQEVCLKYDLLPGDWIVDSGCTKHMTGNRILFPSYKAYDGEHVIFDSNLKSKVIGGGYSQTSKAYIGLNKKTIRIEESLNVTFDESLSEPKSSPSVEDDRINEPLVQDLVRSLSLEANDLESGYPKQVREARGHPIEQVIGELNERALRYKGLKTEQNLLVSIMCSHFSRSRRSQKNSLSMPLERA
ncbi:hypothetical protein Tco_0436486 [Tanacetum coccineum]